METNRLYNSSDPTFASIFDHASIGIALVRPDRVWLRANKAVTKILGYSEEELLALRSKDITHPDDYAVQYDYVEMMLRGELESFEMEKRYRHKAGHYVWAQINVSLVRDEQGQPLCFISQITDINKRKLAEAALRSSKERLELVIQGTGVGLWDWQVQSGATVFNERWAEIAGYTLAELEPISIETWNRLAHPDDLQRAGEQLAAHFAGANEYYECEVRMRHKAGHWVWVLDRGQVVEWDAAGKPVRMAGTHLDITTRKQAEIDARNYNRLYVTLNQVSKAIMRNKERIPLFQHICDVTVEHNNFPLVCISAVNHSTGEVLPIVYAGRATGYAQTLYINVNVPETMRGPTGTAIREKRICVSYDIATDPAMARWRAEALGYGFRSSASIPLWQRGEIVAIVGLYADEPGFFTSQEQELLNAISEDISFALDAMQTEAETQSTRELFARVFELSPIAKSLVRLADRAFFDVNPALERLLGRPHAEIIGRTASELNIWADENQRRELLQIAIKGGTVRDAEFVFYNAAGEARTGLLYAEIIKHNDDEFILANTVDITERKRVEESLKEAQQAQRLQISTLEAAADAIIITKRDGTLEWVNPAFTTLTGYTADEALGQDFRELLKSDKHDRDVYRNLWETILAGNVWRGELINRRKDGSLYTEAQNITPVRAENGEITHFIAIKRDVTSERQAQLQAQRQERLAAVGQLAAGIAHDFNNIMAVIVLYSEIVARSASLSERERERLLTIHQQAEHAAHMIRQILDFSRQGVMERHPLDLLPLLKEQVKLLERTLPENIEIALTTRASEYVVLADPTRIQQIVMNLAVNARDAMPAGGKLRITLDRIQIDDSNAPFPDMAHGNWVRLALTDTGTGIPEHIMPRLFEPFFTTKAPGEGTGLGLPQVYGIISEHGGYVTVHSQVGQGATFTLYFPALEVQKIETRAALLTDLPHGNGETVLIVEDNVTLRSALTELLTQLNYQTLVAADGEVALQMLDAATQVNVILSDVVMPKMGGIELFRGLRQQGRNTPVILMTGHPLNTEMADLYNLGVETWLAKPLTPEQVAQALTTTLHGED